MSTFPPGTILTRNEPKDNPMDRIRVVGLSPVSAPAAAEWGSATEGEAVVVTPADEFGSNEPAPISFLVQAYSVESYPDDFDTGEDVAGDRPRPKNISSLPTPEQAFARNAQRVATSAESEIE